MLLTFEIQGKKAAEMGKPGQSPGELQDVIFTVRAGTKTWRFDFVNGVVDSVLRHDQLSLPQIVHERLALEFHRDRVGRIECGLRLYELR